MSDEINLTFSEFDVELEMALELINTQIAYLQNFKKELEAKSQETLDEVDEGISNIRTDLRNVLVNVGLSEAEALQLISNAKVLALSGINEKLSDLDSKQSETLTSLTTARSDALGSIEAKRVEAVENAHDYLVAMQTAKQEVENQKNEIINQGKLAHDYTLLMDEKISKYENVMNTVSMNWKSPVPTFADLNKYYPNPKEGWAVQTVDTGKVYRCQDGGWLEILQDLNPIQTLKMRREIDTLTMQVGNGIDGGTF